ncbi:DNA repair protein RAD50 [Psilocybe cubensis]|uniref:DNA repair protein RAD50 n=2 Tax=Psilocybe cubensis TaxID=181762 RepID=A0A8H7Y3U0_PSICU|nr:DNA repair protein RAD50 [Psilocybe cubensis]KAH9480437.1 DNA repair protein RAD50 [Psilocybe cubensis]
MAHLNKLAIRGIRSFDDKQIAIIEFFSPVTVIVGHNGSGKTTIIECLKYATTGDQPPNTRGGAFIHDPKMANEKEVKAQVKLRFHAANGTRMLAVRNLSVTVKKTAGLTMKTLESILAIADGNAERGGKRGVISTKCAEMDTEIPQLLGVSKAVLENVIFCHQEDSYWPLAEPAALKKKFDDIFEATRYTKALDSIKSLRKDRMAELKAEKERLVSLSREKAHADKLKERISELKSNIAAKEVEYEETKQEYDTLVESNKKFRDLYENFRETYMRVESLQQNKALQMQYLEDLKLKYRAVPGTLEELETRANQFQQRIEQQKEKRKAELRNKEELEEEVNSVQATQRDLFTQQGRLEAEAEEQRKRINLREKAIHEIAEAHRIKGFSQSPLEREQVLNFLSKLGDVQRVSQNDFEKLQSDLKLKEEEYHTKLRKLDNELASHKSQQERLREQTIQNNDKVKKIERTLGNMEDLPTKMRVLQANLHDKTSRLQTAKSTMDSSNFEARMAELADGRRRLEDERDKLNNELQGLTLQAESRAKLELKRGEINTKTVEIESIADYIVTKLNNVASLDVTANDIESQLNKLVSAAEDEQKRLEKIYKDAQSQLQMSDAAITNFKEELDGKINDAKILEANVKKRTFLGGAKNLDDAIDYASHLLQRLKVQKGQLLGSSKLYEQLLEDAKTTNACTACRRKFKDRTELEVFKQELDTLMKAGQTESLDDVNESLEDWQAELNSLQGLRTRQIQAEEIRAKDIPDLEKKMAKIETVVPEQRAAIEKVGEELEMIKTKLKEIIACNQQAASMSRLRKEVDRAKQEVEQLEKELTRTGSTKTADDVKGELTRITDDLRKNERENKNISLEFDRQSRQCRDYENEIHQMQLDERDLSSKLQEKERLEEEVERLKRGNGTYATQIKEIDGKISEAQAPILALQEGHQRIQRDLNTKIGEAQRRFEELNRSMDKLVDMNKNAERYVKEKKARALEECSSSLEQCEIRLNEIHTQIEGSRELIASIDKEINESGATESNLRDNIQVQKLTRDIAKTQAEIDSYDMEEAAKARRNYEDKYEPTKRKEVKLSETVHQLTGELGTLKAQSKTLDNDLKEYKDVYKNYTDQLIRVKVSDMANNDLEKYAKALDNAIMKYHGLKMEEVNDTMKHLWNKTYQGTDIDGIKIRSDVEGGASKRSYNYRVVMTKDQVEMDMRGRCSAGQKMLASIIIRLALSDSFGQNCGILALDEPTNALDTENIDALAASLVDIINERKTHSNFQLIVITHDENFLRKLGQSDVMEYYWRVARDSRQKSVIERHRFR